MARRHVPKWCDTPVMRDHWLKPWTVSPDGRRARRFKKLCWEHGFLSPNFTRAECASKDGKRIPSELRGPAQKQAFRMEKYRHAIGDKPIGFVSWYRSPSHNAVVGGATKSQHVRACATDREFIASIAKRIWTTGGIGWAGPGIGNGAILHTDSRPGGSLAQWSYS